MSCLFFEDSDINRIYATLRNAPPRVQVPLAASIKALKTAEKFQPKLIGHEFEKTEVKGIQEAVVAAGTHRGIGMIKIDPMTSLPFLEFDFAVVSAIRA